MIFVTVSTGHFDPLIEACNRLSEKYEFFGQIGMGTVVPKFKSIRTCSPTELNEYMQQAELVISHAGTGMLSRLYQLKKRTIICPKQIRYGESNDGQVELGKKWAELGMGILCMDVNELEQAIQASFQAQFQFPAFESLGTYLSQHFGFTPLQEPVSLIG